MYLPKIRITFKDNTQTILNCNRIVSFTCSENLTDTNVSITPGVCEQYANIKIYDKDEFFHNKAIANTLSDEMVEIYVIDTDDAELTEIILGKYLVSKWDVKGDSSIIEITCRDTTYLLSNISITESEIQDRTVTQFLDLVFSQVPDMSYQFLDNDTQYRCNQISTPNSWYNKSSLLDLLNKICYLGMLRMFYKQGVFYIARCV